SHPARRAKIADVDAESVVPRPGELATSTNFPQWDRARVETAGTRRHRRTISADGHSASFRSRRLARRNCSDAFMDAGHDCPVITQNGGCNRYSAAVLLCRSDRTSRLECARGDNGFDPNRWLVFRAKGISRKQPGRRSVFYSLLE